MKNNPSLSEEKLVERRKRLRWREVTVLVAAFVIAVCAGLLVRHGNESHPGRAAAAATARPTR
jgi:hypothetical protein